MSVLSKSWASNSYGIWTMCSIVAFLDRCPHGLIGDTEAFMAIAIKETVPNSPKDPQFACSLSYRYLSILTAIFSSWMAIFSP